MDIVTFVYNGIVFNAKKKLDFFGVIFFFNKTAIIMKVKITV